MQRNTKRTYFHGGLKARKLRWCPYVWEFFFKYSTSRRSMLHSVEILEQSIVLNNIFQCYCIGTLFESVICLFVVDLKGDSICLTNQISNVDNNHNNHSWTKTHANKLSYINTNQTIVSVLYLASIHTHYNHEHDPMTRRQ